ncbi:ATP-binding protein, partial [Escherichia coli]
EFAGTRLIRPLLARTRGELAQWALAHGLRWIEDESNQDDSYDRNFLRLRVVPLLQQRWPHFAEATARSAALCAEQESLLDELLADDLAHCQTSQGTLQIAPMLAMSDARRAAIIRRWLAGQNSYAIQQEEMDADFRTAFPRCKYLPQIRAEMLMQEDDFEICESILRQQEKLRERIDETLSEKIVQKCRNMNGT